MREEELVNRLACGLEIFALERGPHIGDRLNLRKTREHLFNLLCCIAVSCINNGQPERIAKARPRTCGAKQFCDFDHMRARAAIHAACKQHDIGPKVPDALDALIIFPAVIGRDAVEHDGARAKGCALRGFRGHFPHDPRGHHLQAAPCRTCREIQVDAFARIVSRHHEGGRIIIAKHAPAAQLFKFLERIARANRDIGKRLLNGRRRLAAKGLMPSILPSFEEECFRRGRSAVRDEDRAQRFFRGNCAHSPTSTFSAGSQSERRNCIRSTSSAMRAMTVEPKKAPKHTIMSRRPAREAPCAVFDSLGIEKKK